MNNIHHIFHINAPFEKVFKALSISNGIGGWWTPDTSGNSIPGGILTLKFGEMAQMQLKVLELEKNKTIVWENISGMPAWIGSIIRFELSTNDNKVRINFTHSGFKSIDTDYLAAINFTWGRYLVSLRNLCEKGKGNPFPE